MSVDTTRYFQDAHQLAALTPNPIAAHLQGSMIIAIATEIRGMRERGETVSDFTIGDFDPKLFPIPEVLTEAIQKRLEQGATNYPAAAGQPELRNAIRKVYKEHLHVDYPAECFQVTSGARPPIYAAFHTLIAPGDTVVYPVPSWNNNYYSYLTQAKEVRIETAPEKGFMPDFEDIEPHLGTARMLVLNSPSNPCGTAMAPAVLKRICEAIVAENNRRAPLHERPLYLLYDQVYWRLTFDGVHHANPVHLVPEMARYTILVDAISKGWAATGVRVGWFAAPPWLVERMRALIGHMGAWAPKAEQLATADVMADPDSTTGYMLATRGEINGRLDALHKGFQALKAAGLPVDSVAPQGAIYLSAKFDLIGKSYDGRLIDSDEAMRKAVLQGAGVAMVPFTAFGSRPNSGWARLSVGSVSHDDVARALVRLGEWLPQVR